MQTHGPVESHVLTELVDLPTLRPRRASQFLREMASVLPRSSFPSSNNRSSGPEASRLGQVGTSQLDPTGSSLD